MSKSYSDEELRNREYGTSLIRKEPRDNVERNVEYNRRRYYEEIELRRKYGRL